MDKALCFLLLCIISSFATVTFVALYHFKDMRDIPTIILVYTIINLLQQINNSRKK